MALIGKQAIYAIGNALRVLVSIQDARMTWGKAQVLIAPVSGSGETWVNLDSLVL
jgi:hypothetical protein